MEQSKHWLKSRPDLDESKSMSSSALSLECNGKRWAAIENKYNTYKIAAIVDGGIDPSFFAMPTMRYLFGKTATIRWNGTLFPTEDMAGWRSSPTWLPIAWFCCKVDREAGSRFAKSILESPPDDDTAALIACDWLEENGIVGYFFMKGIEYQQMGSAQEDFPDWKLEDSSQVSFPFDIKSAKFDLNVAGPVASWCRQLIKSRCVSCGGLRSGDDCYSSRIPGPRRDVDSAVISNCEVCGHKKHLVLPGINLPRLSS